MTGQTFLFLASLSGVASAVRRGRRVQSQTAAGRCFDTRRVNNRGRAVSGERDGAGGRGGPRRIADATANSKETRQLVHRSPR